MTTYKEIRGTNIEAVASDPSNPVVGQVWYNTTSNTVKGLINNLGSWATANIMNTGRNNVAGVGTQTAALAFGGTASPGITNATEIWNGTNWTEVNNLQTARAALAGAGTTTSALAFGGNPPRTGKTEQYNGTNWTEVNDLNTARNSLSGAGASNTSALAFGGIVPPDNATAVTELWNGTNWTEVNDMNTARRELSGAGSSNTNALAISGRGKEVESWNGTNWTEVGDINNLKNDSGAAGTNTAAIAFGGESPAAGGTNSDNTEIFNAGPTTITFDVS